MIATATGRTSFCLLLILASGCGEGHTGTQELNDPIAASFTIHTDHGPVRSPRLLGLADNPASRAQGLMGQRHLPRGYGMVFMFDEPTSTTFWMKDTLIPLSLVVWNERGRIADILDMTPCRVDPCRRYRPRGPFIGAVEMQQGYFERNGVEVGDRIDVQLLTY